MVAARNLSWAIYFIAVYPAALTEQLAGQQSSQAFLEVRSKYRMSYSILRGLLSRKKTHNYIAFDLLKLFACKLWIFERKHFASDLHKKVMILFSKTKKFIKLIDSLSKYWLFKLNQTDNKLWTSLWPRVECSQFFQTWKGSPSAHKQTINEVIIYRNWRTIMVMNEKSFRTEWIDIFWLN